MNFEIIINVFLGILFYKITLQILSKLFKIFLLAVFKDELEEEAAVKRKSFKEKLSEKQNETNQL
jgi:hypothetical protein